MMKLKSTIYETSKYYISEFLLNIIIQNHEHKLT